MARPKQQPKEIYAYCAYVEEQIAKFDEQEKAIAKKRQEFIEKIPDPVMQMIKLRSKMGDLVLPESDEETKRGETEKARADARPADVPPPAPATNGAAKPNGKQQPQPPRAQA